MRPAGKGLSLMVPNTEIGVYKRYYILELPFWYAAIKYKKWNMF